MSGLWVPTTLGRLYARSWGERTGRAPIVLFHDSLGCVDLWRDFPERLAEATGRQVVAYDRLGFGRSDPYPGRQVLTFVQDEAAGGFTDLRNHLEIKDFVAFGHSIGGGMAIVAAAAFPETCRALITESAQAFNDDGIRAGIREAESGFLQPGQMDRLRKYHGDKAEWVLKAWTETWLSSDFAGWTLDADLRRVTCPVLALHGQADEYGSTAHPQSIGALSAGSVQVEILPECGHVPHREKSGAVLELVKTFLE